MTGTMRKLDRQPKERYLRATQRLFNLAARKSKQGSGSSDDLHLIDGRRRMATIDPLATAFATYLVLGLGTACLLMLAWASAANPTYVLSGGDGAALAFSGRLPPGGCG